MGSLDRIITENALLAIERGRDDDRLSHVNLTTRGIANAMARYFEPTVNVKTGELVDPPKPESVYTQLRLLLQNPPRASWDARYLEAFARVVETPPSRLCAPDYDAGKTSATDYATFLIRAFGQELDSPQIQRFVRMVREVVAIPERFALLERIAHILSHAESKADADFRVSEAIRRSRNWDSEHPDAASKSG